jgi:hypothetical protein
VVACPLRDLCGARSGDKADVSDVTLFADDAETYALLVEQVTAARVRAHFGALVAGDVVRYEAPNVWAVKFVMHHALDGGATASLRSDTQGKTHGLSLLRLVVDVPQAVVDRSRRRHRPPTHLEAPCSPTTPA